eukprot:3283071-Amphidinium_carterae.1
MWIGQTSCKTRQSSARSTSYTFLYGLVVMGGILVGASGIWRFVSSFHIDLARTSQLRNSVMS